MFGGAVTLEHVVSVSVDDLVGRSRGERHDMECGNSLLRLHRTWKNPEIMVLLPLYR